MTSAGFQREDKGTITAPRSQIPQAAATHCQPFDAQIATLGEVLEHQDPDYLVRRQALPSSLGTSLSNQVAPYFLPYFIRHVVEQLIHLR